MLPINRTVAGYFAAWSAMGGSAGMSGEDTQDKSACAANPFSLAGQQFVLCMAVGRGHEFRQAFEIQQVGMHGHYCGLEGIADDQRR